MSVRASPSLTPLMAPQPPNSDQVESGQGVDGTAVVGGNENGDTVGFRDLQITDVGNMLKAFIGLNFMYVSYAFSKAGIAAGVVGLLVITYLNYHCCVLLIKVKRHVCPREEPVQMTTNSDQATTPQVVEEPKHVTYGDVADTVAGPIARNLVTLALILTQFGYCVGYLIFMSQTIHDLIKSTHAVFWFVTIPLPILFGLALLRSLRSLGPFSLLANASLLIGFISVVSYISMRFKWEPPAVSFRNFPLFFGQMTAALEGIGLVIPVEGSMKNPLGFEKVLQIALVILTSVLMTVGVLGFATFGASTRSIILLNMGSGTVVSVVKVVLVVGILFTYPLQLVPVIHSLESFLGISHHHHHESSANAESRQQQAPEFELENQDFDDADTDDESESKEDWAEPRSDIDSLEREELSSATSVDETTQPRRRRFVHKPKRIVARAFIVCATAAIAMLAGASFGLFQSLVGSLGASVLAYTAPAILHLKTFEGEMNHMQKTKDWAIIFFGVTGSLVGTAVTVWEISKIHSGEIIPQ
eukprot:Plantae.Rhodophyta-Hildenbrandia_rubra.ctg6009.p1 GENE.Plantae.Rhodophyta-Hildenbrandia_rubra.ctg6009~~Plantae.Rhodophyta-Hildenbrandia_rubra.ctg6009.p1  ORF type:complete len:530 (-),score=94.97 Plantae.Rhodophyta-Hildenbrandia_rubra.ctg6009:1506-3095(-)